MPDAVGTPYVCTREYTRMDEKLKQNDRFILMMEDSEVLYVPMLWNTRLEQAGGQDGVTPVVVKPGVFTVDEAMARVSRKRGLVEDDADDSYAFAAPAASSHTREKSPLAADSDEDDGQFAINRTFAYDDDDDDDQ